MRPLALLTALSLAACSGLASPDDWTRVPGTLDPTLSSVQMVRLPQEIYAGSPFTVVVTTIGHDSCWRGGGTEVGSTGATIRLKPFDYVLREPRACRESIQGLEHPVTLTLPSPGAASLIIEGVTYGREPVEHAVAVTVLDPGTVLHQR